MLALKAIAVLLFSVAEGAWWERPWRNSWLNISLEGQEYQILTRRVGEGSRKVFCVQGGPGGSFWDLNFLAVYLDLQDLEIIQYNPLGSWPSACSSPSEDCYHKNSWMTLPAFVSTMDQVYSALALPSNTVVVAHGFGVTVALEFALRWPKRVAGLVFSDGVPSQEQSMNRHVWCDGNMWQDCRVGAEGQPWLEHIRHNHTELIKAIWGPKGNGVGGNLENWDVRNRLSSLRTIPSLSLVGEYGLVFPQDVKEMSVALGGEYRLLHDAGHQSFVDRRRTWLQAFDAWQRHVPHPSVGCADVRGPKGSPEVARGEPVPQIIGGRRYYLSMPTTYRSDRPHNLILSFHGLLSVVQHAPLFGAVPPEWGDTIIAYPLGKEDVALGGVFGGTWNGSGSVGSPGPAGATCNKDKVIADKVVTICADSCVQQGGCRDPCWLTTCTDDVGFIINLLDELERRFCLNVGSVHVMGFSGGGWFAVELGTNARIARRFKSILSFAGLPFRGFNVAPALKRGSRFVGVYGRADVLVPGFPNSPADPTEAVSKHGFAFSSWANTTRMWASTFGCGALQNTSRIHPFGGDGDMECFDYDCSEGGVSVCLWGGPHTIAPQALSLATQTFFPALPLPAPAVLAPGLSEGAEGGRALLPVLAVACSLALLLPLYLCFGRRAGQGLSKPLLLSEP